MALSSYKRTQRGLELAASLCLLLTSAAGLMIEIVAARLVAPYVGMSVYTWTVIITVVLTGMSLGNWLGGRLATGSLRQTLGRAALLLFAAALTTLIIPPLLRGVAPGLLGSALPLFTALTLLTIVLFLLPSILAAALAPIMTTVALAVSREPKSVVIGRMFALGSAGAIAGTLLTGLVFLSFFGANATLVFVSILLLALGAFFALPGFQRRWQLSYAGAALVLLAATGIARESLLLSPCTEESAFYCLRIEDVSADVGREASLMVIDHMGHGINDAAEPTLLHMSYTELAHRLTQERLRSTEDFTGFFLGAGAMSLPRAWAASFPGTRHVVAEIDPEVTALARSQMDADLPETIETLHHDARYALQHVLKDRRFDVIVSDAFHDFSMPAHLATREFAQAMADRLTPEGFVLMNVIDGAARPLFLSSLVRTFRTAFPVVEVWADLEQLRSSDRLTYLVVAGTAPTARGDLSSPDFPGRVWVRMTPDNMVQLLSFEPSLILTDNLAPVDRLLWAVANESR